MSTTCDGILARIAVAPVGQKPYVAHALLHAGLDICVETMTAMCDASGNFVGDR